MEAYRVSKDEVVIVTHVVSIKKTALNTLTLTDIIGQQTEFTKEDLDNPSFDDLLSFLNKSKIKI